MGSHQGPECFLSLKEDRTCGKPGKVRVCCAEGSRKQERLDRCVGINHEKSYDAWGGLSTIT